MLNARSSVHAFGVRRARRFEFKITQLESYAQFRWRDARRDTQDFVQRVMSYPVRHRWHPIEVFAHDLARQENRADAKASLLDFGRHEVLIAFV